MDGNGSVRSGSRAASSVSSGTKRKRQGEAKFYAVRAGYKPGVYCTWSDCLEQVKGYKKALFKSFPSLTDAERFVAGDDISSTNGSASSPPTKFYAVRNGRIPGIYTDWQSVQEQITGWQKPQHRSFSTRSEAQRYLDGEGQLSPGHANDPSIDFAQFFTPNALAGAAFDTLAETNPAPEPRESKKTKKAVNGWKAAKVDEPEYNEALYAPGTGPLPPGAEDGFDQNILLNPRTGELVYKTPEQRQATKAFSSTSSSTDSIHIYTDGSSLGNGKSGAYAGVGVYFGPKDKRNVSEPLPGPRQTNQRAELTAMLRALEIAPRNRHVVIHSDSKYAIECVTSWYVNWRRNGWKTASGKTVENKDLIEHILGKVEERTKAGSAQRTARGEGESGLVRTQFIWVKGHDGDVGNEEADRLATEGARNSSRVGGSA